MTEGPLVILASRTRKAKSGIPLEAATGSLLPQRWHSHCPPHHPHGTLCSTDLRFYQTQRTHNHPHQAIAAVVDQLVEKPLASPKPAWEPHLPMPPESNQRTKGPAAKSKTGKRHFTVDSTCRGCKSQCVEPAFPARPTHERKQACAIASSRSCLDNGLLEIIVCPFGRLQLAPRLEVNGFCFHAGSFAKDVTVESHMLGRVIVEASLTAALTCPAGCRHHKIAIESSTATCQSCWSITPQTNQFTCFFHPITDKSKSQPMETRMFTFSFGILNCQSGCRVGMGNASHIRIRSGCSRTRSIWTALHSATLHTAAVCIRGFCRRCVTKRECSCVRAVHAHGVVWSQLSFRSAAGHLRLITCE